MGYTITCPYCKHTFNIHVTELKTGYKDIENQYILDNKFSYCYCTKCNKQLIL